MTNKDRLISLCVARLQKEETYNDVYKKRLEEEIKEINAQSEWDYFLDIYDKNLKYENENNLLIPYLLNICDEFDISKPPTYIYGDMPDVDIDYLPEVREYLKEKFAKEQFGEDHVCNICNYNTFGMRSALIDMARVYGKDRGEVMVVTKQLKPKDDQGETMTWDKALELYDDLKDYCQENPEVFDAAKRLFNRNRSLGQHASGLIISGVPIKDFIPLVRGKGGSQASAWVEGLHGTDLGAVGLVKFDFLSLDGNMKIAMACKLAMDVCKKVTDSVEDKYKYCISALPGQASWTDTNYLNDKKAIEMANDGDLKMIFQFDGSEGIRRMAKQGGVTCFDDLVAYTALFRPGPMKLGYHEKYINRKRGTEKYTIHPLLKDALGTTHGVLVYQEQIMRILNTIGKIHLKDCETVRKAISKKKIDKFEKYKKSFIINGQELLGWSKSEVEHLWKQIEAFAGYGFNLSHAVAYAYISSRMLYLKAHHPYEFYASVFTCVKATGPDDYQRLKEYKQEAERHGIKIEQLDINKSKAKFNIQDGKIYYGFDKIKGIGEQTASKLEKLQPYKDFDDFLLRFGTEAKVVQAAISLGCFPGDKLTLYKYYEAIKDYEKKINSREKRFITSLKKLEEQRDIANEDERETIVKKIEKLKAGKEKRDKLYSRPTITDFNTNIKIDPTVAKMMSNESNQLAEMAFYGFLWNHPLEKCTHYTGYTFENFNIQDYTEGPIEVLVKSVKEMKGKKVTYYLVAVEDAMNETKKITVWSDDYKRFVEELTPGNMVRMSVTPPKPPFLSYTLKQFPNKYKKPVKELDHRIKLIN
jgi:DNA polymerase III subunit alpha